MEAYIAELAHADGLPEKAIRHCLDHPDQVVPGFLDLLRQYAGNPGPGDDRDDALFFITHILGELGEKRAFVPLLDFVSGDPQRLEEILGDAVTETLVQILVSVFDGQTDPLYRVMNDPSVDEFVRYATFMTWAYAAASGQVGRQEVEQYLSGCVDNLQPRRENYVWVAWIDCIAYLGLETLEPLVRQAFDKGLVPYRAIDWQDFEEALAQRLAADDPMEFLASKRIEPFRDTIGTLSKWYAFSPAYIQAKREAEQNRQHQRTARTGVTAANPYRHVGRNDPCPCGSGEKFKKCCL